MQALEAVTIRIQHANKYFYWFKFLQVKEDKTGDSLFETWCIPGMAKK